MRRGNTDEAKRQSIMGNYYTTIFIYVLILIKIPPPRAQCLSLRPDKPLRVSRSTRNGAYRQLELVSETVHSPLSMHAHVF